VRRSDAHAWAEVWLQGRGWVRVDPTAAVAPERIYDTLADRAPGADGLFGALMPTPVFNASDWLRRSWNDFALGFDAARQRRLLRPLGLMDLDSGRLIALFTGIASLVVLWMAWLTARAERERDPVLRAWHELGTRYARLGLAREPHELPRTGRNASALPAPGWKTPCGYLACVSAIGVTLVHNRDLRPAR
jgi:hypothetical protein